MNILQMEDLVKGMPDQLLMQEAQMPSGQIPQFLSLSEIQRRKEMRDKLQAPPQATVADQILQGGIAAAMPQQPPQGGMGPPPGGPPMGPPMGPQGAPVMAYGGGMMPYRMYGGGRTPGMVYMQQGETVPDTDGTYKRLQGIQDIRLLVQQGSPTQIRNAFVEAIKSGDDQTAGVIQNFASSLGKGNPNEFLEIGKQLRTIRSQERRDLAESERAAAEEKERLSQQTRANYLLTGQQPPAESVAAPPGAPLAAVNVSALGMTPSTGGAMPVAPAQNAASLISEITSVLPDATRALSGMNTGIPDVTRLLRGAEPVQAQYEALIPDFSPFIQQVEQRGKESVQRYEQSIKDIENRMKQERLGAVLTTLGANLMAGEGALGLEKAGLTAQQIGKEMRQEVAAERRALDVAREGTADKVLGLQLQQVTADTGAKRDFLKANDEFRKLGVQIAVDQGKEARAAQRDMNQLALNLASNTISRLKSLDEQNALNTRSFVTAMSAESDTILKLLEQMTLLTDPNEKIKKYNQLMESKIRGYGALYPNIDISSVIAAFKQDTGETAGTAAQSGPREKSISSFMNP